MQKTAKKIITLALLASFVCGPSAFAQTTLVAEPAPEATTAPAVDTPVTPAPVAVPAEQTPPTDPVVVPAPVDTVTLQASSTELQDTTNTQPAVTGDALVNTGDPTATSTLTEGSIIPLIYTDTATSSATTTDPASTPIVEASSTPAVTPVETDQTPVDVAAPVEPVVPTPDTPAISVPLQVSNNDEVQPIAMVEAPEKPKFDFAVTGKTLAAKKKIKNAAGEVVGESSVNTSLTSSIDNKEGVMQLSGQCTDTSYVVLLYKNQDDYLNDPRSYIVNSAYPCVNGSFSYGLSQLPSTLQNGQYYLLIAQQGKTGGWSPITGVTEITINRAQ